MWSNFHTHSNFCDGKGALDDYVAKAKSLGMVSLGFSSHAPLPFDCTWCMKKEDFSNYKRDVENLKSANPSLEIHTGLEIDFIPNVISPSQFNDQLDYTIGSIHFVEKFQDGLPWEIDGSQSVFLAGLEKIFNNNSKDAITRYFELTRQMVTQACPTVIGHLDKIKIQNTGNVFFAESDTWYQEEIKKTLTVIQASGAIIEVNTRGIYKKKCATPYPSPWILEMICQKNIPITLHSDAHHPDDLITQFSETARLLAEIGFKRITILHEGRWQPYAFNEYGIILR